MLRAAALGYAEKVRPQLLSLRQTDLALHTKLDDRAKNTADFADVFAGENLATHLVALDQRWRMHFSPQPSYHHARYGLHLLQLSPDPDRLISNPSSSAKQLFIRNDGGSESFLAAPSI
jgi:hypothetical protein